MTKERIKQCLEWLRWEMGMCLNVDAKPPAHPRISSEEHAEVRAEWAKNPDGRSSYSSTLYAMLARAERGAA